MRTVAVLLVVMMTAPAVLAVKPKKQEKSLEQTLDYVNQHLLVFVDYSNMKCSEKLQLSISDDRQEIIVKHLLIDKHGRVIDNLPPKYLYRIPVSEVKRVYPWGPWTTYDRVVVRTYGRAVSKYGPLWDCEHRRLNTVPRERLLDSVDLKMADRDDAHLSGVIQSINHLVKLLQAGPDAKTEPEQGAIPDPDE